MATYNEYLKGKSKWCHNSRLDKYGVWSIQLYLDEESKNKIIEMQTKGLKNTLKKDEDGYYIKLKRPPEVEIMDYKTNGKKKITMYPPLTFDADGKVLENTLIGNGSDVTVKVQVYSFGGKGGIAKGIAARWESIRCDNLVPYTKDNLNPEDERKSRGLMDQPSPEF